MQLLTVQEVAELLNVSKSLAYSLISSGKIACHRIGQGRGAIRVHREDLDLFLKNCKVQVKQPSARISRPRLKHLRLK